MITGKQHHIAIICSDYEKAREFYIEKLGFELYREIYRPAQKDYLRMLRLGDTVIELFIRPDAPQRVNNPEAMGLRHLALHGWAAAASKQSPSGKIPTTAAALPSLRTPTVCRWSYTNNDREYRKEKNV